MNQPLFDVQTLIWLLPIMFILHDFEEIIMYESWMKKNSGKMISKLPKKLANQISKHFSMTTAQMAAAVLLIFLIISSAALLANQYVNDKPLANIHVFTVIILTFFLHVFTHVGQSIFFRSVTPGVITSIFIVLPYSLITLYALLSVDIIDWKTILKCLPFVLLVVPIVLLAHWFGKKIA
ncbi:HXXEE domain-containing protein [Peribacillus sp. SCS-155]|uniref:HXXEE domain-containing protein n=1 Tax=Peribacillus sedimenti TaxID=3115297 RepID=UPI0039069816